MNFEQPVQTQHQFFFEDNGMKRIVLLGNKKIGKTVNMMKICNGYAYLPVNPYDDLPRMLCRLDIDYSYSKVYIPNIFLYKNLKILDVPSSLYGTENIKTYITIADKLIIFTNNKSDGVKKWMNTIKDCCSIHSYSYNRSENGKVIKAHENIHIYRSDINDNGVLTRIFSNHLIFF